MWMLCLKAELSDPSYKASSLSAKAWADQHYIVVRAKDKGGLLEQNKRLHEMNERLLRKEVASLGLTTKGKTPAIIEGTSKVEGKLDVLGQLEALKSENVDLKTEIAENKMEIAEHKMEIAHLKKEIVELINDRAQQKEINTWLVGRIQALEEKCLGMRPMEKVQMRKLIEACREKCKSLLVDGGIPIPMRGELGDVVDWDVLLARHSQNYDSIVGLTMGLDLAKNIPRDFHRSAHKIQEKVEAFVDIISKLDGHMRQKMENVLCFVYPQAKQMMDALFEGNTE